VPDYESGGKRVHFTTGTFLHFRSEDLLENVKIAKELIEILQKKRFAMEAKKERHQRDLSGHVEKVDAVNKRYEVLRQKLEIEWQKELSSLEEDKARTFLEFKNAEARLNEIDYKLEAYRIEDHNLKLDRWSLDPSLYLRK
jgi:chromosome segregation ATPase